MEARHKKRGDTRVVFSYVLREKAHACNPYGFALPKARLQRQALVRRWKELNIPYHTDTSTFLDGTHDTLGHFQRGWDNWQALW